MSNITDLHSRGHVSTANHQVSQDVELQLVQYKREVQEAEQAPSATTGGNCGMKSHRMPVPDLQTAKFDRELWVA